MAAFTTSPIATWWCDRATLGVTAANDAARRAFGWTELAGVHLRDARGAIEAAARDRGLGAWAIGSIEIEAAVVADGDGWLIQATRVGRRAFDRIAPLLELDDEGFAISDVTGRVEYISPAFERILGVPTGEMIGQSGVAHFRSAEEVERQRATFTELLRDPGGSRLFLARFRTTSGEERWLESRVTNLLDDPITRGLISRFRDVTDRVRAREALEVANRRLEYLLSATSALVYTCRAEPPFGATFMSDNVVGVLGYTPQQFIDDPAFWIDRLHPDERSAILEGVARTFEDGRHVHEYRFRHADGSYRWMHDELVLVRGDDGRPREMIGCFYDVTALRSSERNFRALIEDLPIAVLVNRDDKIVYVNPKMVELLGYPNAAHLVGRPAFSIVTPRFAEAARTRSKWLEEAPGTAHTPLAEGEMVRADGGVVAVEIEGVRLAFDGQPANLVLARDVTERHAMVTRLAASDRLASVGMLAAGVAHEINNPLAYLQTTLAVLGRELPDWTPGSGARLSSSELTRLLGDAQDGTARIRALVRDLRLLSHPDQESVTSIDVRDVMTTCLHMAENEMRHRARAIVQLAEVPRVQGNPARLSQVFLNLIVNALQAIPDGGLERNQIRVATYRAASGAVIVEVSDTGVGIPPSVLGHIFDPFFTTKPIGVGTGLGLAISRGIVKSMGGDITVDTEVGRGTTFRVILPPFEGHAAGAAPIEPARGEIARMKILVIDDEPALARALGTLLGEEHDVVAELRATDALARVKAGAAFDIVLCDLMMPEMTGMEFFAELVRVAPALARKVVFLTGGAFTPESRDFLERVPNPRLEKPFDIDALFALLEKVRTS